MSIPFAAAPSFCNNKWCTAHGVIPATGSPYPRCGDAITLEKQKLATGGITGRGVTPCPFGYLDNANTHRISPYHGGNLNAIFFEPKRLTAVPPQGDTRPLRRIGNEWRNN